MLIASIANVLKNITFLLAAASRANLNVRFAKRNNIGDLAGKTVSQFTASTLVGVFFGMGLSKMIDITSLYHLLPVFAVMTVANLYFTV